MGQNRFLEKKTAPVYPIPKKKFQFLQPRGKKSKISKKNALKCSQSRFFRENFFFETTISRNFDRFRILDKKKSTTEIFF